MLGGGKAIFTCILKLHLYANLKLKCLPKARCFYTLIEFKSKSQLPSHMAYSNLIIYKRTIVLFLFLFFLALIVCISLLLILQLIFSNLFDTLVLNYFFENEVFLYLGSVRPSVQDTQLLIVNLGRLELTYRLQTFKEYSYGSQVPCEKRSNSIIDTGTSIRPFLTCRFFAFLTFYHKF